MGKFVIQISKLTVVTSVLLLSSQGNVSGTANEGEILYYKGEKHVLFSTPLEPHMEQFEDTPEVLKSNLYSTANWRGYVGTWEIVHDSLFLVRIEVEYWLKSDDSSAPSHATREVDIGGLFPGEEAPIFADWYSDTLRIPKGELLRYVHMDFGSIYERDLLLEVKSGVVVGESERDNHGVTDYRSRGDLSWCAIVGYTVDTGNWIDGRLLCTPYMDTYRESGETFRTRGLFYEPEDPPYERLLCVENSMKTDDIDFYLYNISSDTLEDEVGDIEVEAAFIDPDLCHHLRVVNFRSLEPGETIHSSVYPRIIDSLENSGAFGVIFASPGGVEIYDTVVCERYESFLSFKVDSPVVITLIRPLILDGGPEFTANILDEYGDVIASASIYGLGDYPANFEPCPYLEPGEWYRLYLNAYSCNSMAVGISQSLKQTSESGLEVLFSRSNRNSRKDGGCMGFELIGVRK